jgi:hypothetical protein
MLGQNLDHPVVAEGGSFTVWSDWSCEILLLHVPDAAVRDVIPPGLRITRMITSLRLTTQLTAPGFLDALQPASIETLGSEVSRAREGKTHHREQPKRGRSSSS